MVKIYNIAGTAAGEMKLPSVFSTPYRPDLIQRAVLSSQSNRRQPYGADPLAGKRTSAHFRGARRGFGCMQNREMARGPRIFGSSPGQDFRERFAPQARGGRQSHPPKIDKIWALKINDKERKLALASAIAATADAAVVAARGHKLGAELPVVVENDVQKISKTKELMKILAALKLDGDVERASVRRVRAGRGKMRGRKYKTKKSLLIVVGEDKGVCKAARAIAGVDVCTVAKLNAELLAPGGHAGRLTVWSKDAVEQLTKR
jgi:large subunit ribosomal protein L4e